MSQSAFAAYRLWPALFRWSWPKRFTFTISGPDGDHLIKAIKAGGTFYEQDLLDALAIYLQGGSGIVIDVGANIGNHSLFFSRVLGRECICIEPQAAAINYLTENLASNAARNYSIRKCGLSDAPGRATIATRDGNLGASTLAGTGAGEEVDVTTLDDISRDLGKIDLIKIDAEGMEAKILRGALTTIEKNRPIVTAEAHTPDDLAEITQAISGLGYKIHGPFCWTPTYIFAPIELTSRASRIWDVVRHPRRSLKQSFRRSGNSNRLMGCSKQTPYRFRW